MSPTSLLRGFALLLFLQWISTLIINALGLPFPPSLLGMLLLTALLCGKIIPAQSVEGVCNILISKMGMLFLPAGVSVLLYADVIRAEWLPILVTIVLCSVAVLGATALFLEAMLKGGR
ncbi:CidA/LrgA family protein [uncultured Phascolarctobacterium sp.]|uniref:CidA/LrgA family protein n=1 Tax=uncultured Phascolarctobacterium sp. TaxID=512296 RepID=UPI00262261CB|nr:CidA/LrgA family protein [uncultured Phascolarctobacterium sp.]